MLKIEARWMRGGKLGDYFSHTNEGCCGLDHSGGRVKLIRYLRESPSLLIWEYKMPLSLSMTCHIFLLKEEKNARIELAKHLSAYLALPVTQF